MRCPCPLNDTGTPHPDGDTVTLRDRLDHRDVRTIRQAMSLINGDDEAVLTAQRLATCVEFYMLLGVASWTFVDEKGKPVPVSHKAIRERLFEAEDVESVSVIAEGRYNPVVLLPLVLGASRSSPPTPTDESTSAPTESPMNHPKPSKPSSTTTTRTDGTVTTMPLPAGGSSSSLKSVSAA